MNLIQKIIKSKNSQKEETFKQNCSTHMHAIEEYIELAKGQLGLFSCNKKFMLTDDIDEFIWFLNQIDEYYSVFLRDLKICEYMSNDEYSDKKDKLELEYMNKKKKEYRANFESIYNKFKNMSKGLNVPQRNEILNLMRKAFDFDSSKYYGKTK